MSMFSFFKTHKYSILSVLLVAVAAALGADCSFAMAVEAPDLVSENPTGDIADRVKADGNSYEPKDKPSADHMGLDTQLPGRAATATDVRDAGLEAEDLDPKVVKFRPFKFPLEWYIANKCQQQKVNSYVHGHFRAGVAELDCEVGTNLTYTKSASDGTSSIIIPATSVSNFEALTEYSEVFAIEDRGADNGVLSIFITSVSDDQAKGIVLNPLSAGGTIPAGHKLAVGSTACSESQMRVAPETYLPVKSEAYLQKKIANVIITDEWKEQAKKVPFITADVLHNGLYNFKRKVARTHWVGKKKRIDVRVKELNGNVESIYFEDGVLRQITKRYTWTNFDFDDFIALTKLQFNKNSETNEAVIFCGSEALTNIIKLANNVNTYKRLEFEEVKEMGIIVRKWKDNFGSLDIVYDPTLDDLHLENYMVVLDIKNAVRYYKRNEKQAVQDMKKTGESREAEVTMISMIDCICLKGYNAIIACPASDVAAGLAYTDVNEEFTSVPSLSGADTKKIVYLTTADATHGVGMYQYNGSAWVPYEGEIPA